MKKFNINDYIYIQITEQGWTFLRKTKEIDYIQFCIESMKIEIENVTWYRMQCHAVFDLFPINFGGQPMFNTNIMIDDESIAEV